MCAPKIAADAIQPRRPGNFHVLGYMKNMEFEELWGNSKISKKRAEEIAGEKRFSLTHYCLPACLPLYRAGLKSTSVKTTIFPSFRLKHS
jgi:hypothetical protein